MATMTNTLQHLTIGRTLQAVRLQNEHLAATVLLDQGGDILELTHKKSGVDVLWKVPYPVRDPGIGLPPAGDSYAQWLHYYRGGWQTILPNFGPSVTYRDALLDFHGEVARRPWQLDQEASGKDVEIEISTELASLPLTVKRRVALSPDRSEIIVSEKVTNMSADPVDCMWTHHPVFGAPLLSPESRIYAGAQLIHTDPSYDVAGNDLMLGQVFEWPFAVSKSGARVDLSKIPKPDSGFSRVLFLKDFEEPWCALVNPTIPLGIGFRWNGDLMKYMCFWQETGGARNFPHYGRTYATALEPSACLFGHGLLAAIEETRTQLTLSGGESRTLHLRAVLFQCGRAVERVGVDGEIEFL
jgi:hypothetical protein